MSVVRLRNETLPRTKRGSQRRALRKKTYAIVAVGTQRLKIGAAKDPFARGRDLQCGSAVELVLIATHEKDIERHLHFQLLHHRVHGEWFTCTKEVIFAVTEGWTPHNYSFLVENPLTRDLAESGRDALGSFSWFQDPILRGEQRVEAVEASVPPRRDGGFLWRGKWRVAPSPPSDRHRAK